MQALVAIVVVVVLLCLLLCFFCFFMHRRSADKEDTAADTVLSSQTNKLNTGLVENPMYVYSNNNASFSRRPSATSGISTIAGKDDEVLYELAVSDTAQKPPQSAAEVNADDNLYDMATSGSVPVYPVEDGTALYAMAAGSTEMYSNKDNNLYEIACSGPAMDENVHPPAELIVSTALVKTENDTDDEEFTGFEFESGAAESPIPDDDVQPDDVSEAEECAPTATTAVAVVSPPTRSYEARNRFMKATAKDGEAKEKELAPSGLKTTAIRATAHVYDLEKKLRKTDHGLKYIDQRNSFYTKSGDLSTTPFASIGTFDSVRGFADIICQAEDGHPSDLGEYLGVIDGPEGIEFVSEAEAATWAARTATLGKKPKATV
eukprot:m.1310465 g.1310465  ORF g.1310465 m.1310465 type:complete len:376 (+) comp24825_c0_seq14:1341-2468(+)